MVQLTKPFWTRLGAVLIAIILSLYLIKTSANFSHFLPLSREKQNIEKTLSAIKRHEKKVQFFQPPLSFEKNEGQMDLDSEVKYFTRGNGCTYYFTPQEIAMVLHTKVKESNHIAYSILKLQFIGAKQDLTVKGIEEQDYRTHYFLTNESKKWHTHIANYNKIIYEDVYPGIDAVFYGNHRKLEYDLCVAPGRNPQEILLHIEGAKELVINPDGDLVISTTNDEKMQMHKPMIYQMIDDTKILIEGNFVLLAKNEIGFSLAEYDKNRPLVIDPTLSYSTYMGQDTILRSIAVDSAGNAYVAGETASLFYPTTPGAFQTTLTGFLEVAITKLNADGSALIYSTYLGGTNVGFSQGFGIDVDPLGNAYVTGLTADFDFPITPGAFQTALAGIDVFITKLNPSGSALVYSTFLGGTSVQEAHSIVVDAITGEAFVCGVTTSADFPTTVGAFQTTINGSVDAFVTKLNASGTALVYSTFLGGTGGETANDCIALLNGEAYVVGTTTSSDFPVTPGAFQTAPGSGFIEGFVTKFNVAGSALVYSTYLGGNGEDRAFGVAVDSLGHAYVTGLTDSGDFPTTPGAFQTTLVGQDAYVTKFNPTGTALVYSTFLGGALNNDEGDSIRLDNLNNAYVTGTTSSADFPTTPDAFQSTISPGNHVFITELNSSGSDLIYSTFLGGSGTDIGSDIALDPSGNFYLTGYTDSPDFPTTMGAFQTQFIASGTDGFITKFANPLAPVVTGIVPNSGPESGGTIVTITGSGFTNVISVFFGGNAATFVVDSPTQITAVAPPGVGVVDVIVTTAAGTSAITPADQFTYLPLPQEILPPSRLRACQRKNEFATQTDIINILTWHPPSEGTVPIEYRIYRNGQLTQLIAVISAHERLRFEDHNRKKEKTYTYWVVSIDAFGNVSEPAIVKVGNTK